MSEGRTAAAGRSAGGSNPLARPRLDRDRIVTAALAFVDENSVRELTMRRLGARLDVEAMALYRYVPSRDDLLDGIVDHLVDSLQQDPQVLTMPKYGWQDFLQRLAHGLRRIALAHPIAFPLVVSRPAKAPWLRPPLRSLRWVEIFLSAMVAEGFDDRAAVGAYRSFTSFLLGYLLLEAAARGAEIGPSPNPERGNDYPLSDYPNISRLRDGLAKDTAQAEFEYGLEELLERIGQQPTS